MFSRKKRAKKTGSLLDPSSSQSTGVSEPPRQKEKSPRQKEKSPRPGKGKKLPPLEISEASTTNTRKWSDEYVKLSPPNRTPSPSTTSTTLSTPNVLSPLPKSDSQLDKKFDTLLSVSDAEKMLESTLKEDPMSGSCSTSSSPMHVTRLSTDSSVGTSASATPITEKSMIWDSPHESPKHVTQSPKKSFLSPKKHSKSPKKTKQSPKKSPGSPKKDSQSPKKTSRSPKM